MKFLLTVVISSGFGGWVFYQLEQRTGAGNEKTAAMGAFAAFAVSFVVIFSIVVMTIK